MPLPAQPTFTTAEQAAAGRPGGAQGGRQVHPHGRGAEEHRTSRGRSRIRTCGAGFTRREWARGELPVVPYEVSSISEARFRVDALDAEHGAARRGAPAQGRLGRHEGRRVQDRPGRGRHGREPALAAWTTGARRTLPFPRRRARLSTVRLGARPDGSRGVRAFLALPVAAAAASLGRRRSPPCSAPSPSRWSSSRARRRRRPPAGAGPAGPPEEPARGAHARTRRRRPGRRAALHRHRGRPRASASRGRSSPPTCARATPVRSGPRRHPDHSVPGRHGALEDRLLLRRRDGLPGRALPAARRACGRPCSTSTCGRARGRAARAGSSRASRPARAGARRRARPGRTGCRDCRPRADRPTSDDKARLSAAWLAVPFGVLALALLVPLGFGVVNWRRNRAAERAWARERPGV